MKQKKGQLAIITIAIIVIVALLFIFTGNNSEQTTEGAKTEKTEQKGTNTGEKTRENNNEKDSGDGDKAVSGWRDAVLTDVKTKETFKVSDFKGQVVIMESFAVWCPNCKRQQDNMKELIEKHGDKSIHISINTDPNEDEAKVLEHVNKHGYNWKYTIFPKEATQSLVDEFGTGVVSAPSVPVILICPDGTSRLLERGVKSAEEIKTEIESCN